MKPVITNAQNAVEIKTPVHNVLMTQEILTIIVYVNLGSLMMELALSVCPVNILVQSVILYLNVQLVLIM